MATMYPERVPEGKPLSEITVHDRLRQGLDDSFTVFYSLAWHGRGAKTDGEIDFVIAHPSLGLLAVEVKGGLVSFDPATGVWTQENSKTGETVTINSPFVQVQDNKGGLLRELKADPRWPSDPVTRRPHDCTMGYAVVLPGTTLPDQLPPYAKPEITFDRRHLPDLASHLVACMRYWREVDPRPKLDSEGVSALVSIYGSVLKSQVTIADVLRNDEQRIIELTEQQFSLLDLLSRRRRVAISGCAGSGKTLLAIEKARRLAATGRSVLLVCFNRRLAGYISNLTAGVAGITVRHFHGLCTDAVRQAGLTPPAGAESGDALLQWLPSGLLDAVSGGVAPYDAVIVDEGQDFEREWFEVLEFLVEDRKDGLFYVFYDDNQRLYSDASIPGTFGEPFTLTRDCRNTDQIGRIVRGLYRGQDFQLSGVDGRAVVWAPYPDGASDQLRIARLTETLGQLRKAGGRADDVTVLSPRRASAVWHRRDYGQWRLYSGDERDGNVYFDTIHGFKGQESRIVVLTELELAGAAQAGTADALDELLYVGCSRATTQLVVVAAQSAVARLKALA